MFKKKLLHQIISLLILSIMILIYVYAIEKNEKTARLVIGYLTCLAGIVMFGSPLVSIVKHTRFQNKVFLLSFFHSFIRKTSCKHRAQALSHFLCAWPILYVQLCGHCMAFCWLTISSW